MSFPFYDHPEVEGRHAFLSASKYSWLRYDKAKLRETFDNSMNAALGTKLHEIAKDLITYRIKVQRSAKTFNMYVNDAIGYGMDAERPLVYSENIFGTADAIGYTRANGKGTLRIHDLKMGAKPAKMDQLLIYAAIFFFEYKIRPNDVRVELRIYQHDDIQVYEPDLAEILEVMEIITTMDAYLEQFKSEAR